MTIEDLQSQRSLQSLEHPQEQTTTGPGKVIGPRPIGAMSLWDQIKEDKDPKAVALLELK